MKQKSDIRGYVNPYPPGAATSDGQKHWMLPNTEVYEEDRKGKQIDSLISSVRKGSVVSVLDLYLLAPGAFRPQKRRRILGERIEGVMSKGGDILELSTGNRASKGLPSMLLRAYEMIAASGRKRTHASRGAPIKWNLTREERELALGLWRSRKYINDADRTVAIQQRLAKKITRAWLRRAFGSPHQ